MTTATNIGTRIRTLRKQMRITQADLGAAIGSSRTHVTNIERGKDKPGRELLVAIANELKVSLDWLTEGHGEARPAKALDENEAMLLFAFRQLPEDERYAHLNLMLKRVQRDA